MIPVETVVGGKATGARKKNWLQNQHMSDFEECSCEFPILSDYGGVSTEVY